MTLPACRLGSSVPVDALRLSPAQLRELHDGLDQYRSAEYDRENRFNERFAYRSSQPVRVRVCHPGGSEVEYHVEPRDLSTTGFGFVHGGFIHPESECKVTLTDNRGKAMLVRGTVRRCQFIEGRLHVVGVEFRDKIDLGMFDVSAYGSDDRDDRPGEASMARLVSSHAGAGTHDLTEYVERMAVLTKDVVQALQGARVPLAGERCRSLQKVAGRFGYPPIEQQAGVLAEGFEGNRLAAGWQGNLLQLGSLIEAAKRGLAT